MVEAHVVDTSRQRLVATGFVPASVIVVSWDLALCPLLGAVQALLVRVRRIQRKFGKDVVVAADESDLLTQGPCRRFGETPFGSLQCGGVLAEPLPPHSFRHIRSISWGGATRATGVPESQTRE